MPWRPLAKLLAFLVWATIPMWIYVIAHPEEQIRFLRLVDYVEAHSYFVAGVRSFPHAIIISASRRSTNQAESRLMHSRPTFCTCPWIRIRSAGWVRFGSARIHGYIKKLAQAREIVSCTPVAIEQHHPAPTRPKGSVVAD